MSLLSVLDVLRFERAQLLLRGDENSWNRISEQSTFSSYLNLIFKYDKNTDFHYLLILITVKTRTTLESVSKYDKQDGPYSDMYLFHICLLLFAEISF